VVGDPLKSTFYRRSYDVTPNGRLIAARTSQAVDPSQIVVVLNGLTPANR
jgi:hypothetical protein